jgi:2-dehydropantoate 2-reductase
VYLEFSKNDQALVKKLHHTTPPMTRRYAIIGAGAIGGYYGGLLQRSGADVHFLLHSDYEHVQRHGLVIDSKNGNFVLPHVNAYRDPSAMPPCDIAIVALKTTNNRLLTNILPRVLGHGGAVLLLQNGFGEEDAISLIPGVGAVVAGLCFICSTKTGPGHINHQDFGSVRLGHYAPGYTAMGFTTLTQTLAADLVTAGVSAEIESDLGLARFKKLVWNIPFSGLTTALGLTTAQIVRNPDSRARAIGIMREVVAIAAAHGRSIAAAFVDKMIADTETMRPYYSSMKLDADTGRELEIESMYGRPLAAARSRGLAVPLIEELYQQLLLIQQFPVDNSR